MQETRRYKPSTVSRRTSVLAGFYRTCVIDGVLEHSRAESVPPAHRSGRVGALGEEHGHRVLRVVGKDSRVALVPLPPAVRRAVDRAVDGRDSGPILRDTRGARMHRHAATRRLRHLPTAAGVRLPRMHPHMLRYTFVTTMLDLGVDLRGTDRRVPRRPAQAPGRAARPGGRRDRRG